MRDGADVRLSGKLVRPAGRYAVFVTTNAFEEVAWFYAGKVRFDDPAAAAGSRLASAIQGTIQGEAVGLLDDIADAVVPENSRSVMVKTFLGRCPSYDLTVFLTRAADETHTHVVLLYDPKTETQ